MSRNDISTLVRAAMAGLAAILMIFGSADRAVAGEAPAAPSKCTKVDFEGVVEEAAAALRDLNDNNKPAFQEKLRQLKEKRGWSHDQFLNEAAPFVKDDQIDVWDAESSELLSRITAMGQEGSVAKSPDCALLADLRAQMSALVAAQTAKWTYIFQKIDGALAQ